MVLILVAGMGLLACQPGGKSSPVEANYAFSGSVYSDGSEPALWTKDGLSSLPSAGDWPSADDSTYGDGLALVVGNYQVSETSDYRPCLWKNGAQLDLEYPDGSIGAFPHDVAVSGGKVRVAGYYNDANEGLHPALWVDGSLSALDAETNGSADAVTVKDGQTYVAGGRTDSEGTRESGYWLGSDFHPYNSNDFPDCASYYPHGIGVTASSVYTMGYANEIWYLVKDGVPTEVPSGYQLEELRIVEGQPLIVGVHTSDRAATWAGDGAAEVLLDLPEGYTSSSARFVQYDAGEILIGGNVSRWAEGNEYRPVLWRNGVPEFLPTGDYADTDLGNLKPKG